MLGCIAFTLVTLLLPTARSVESAQVPLELQPLLAKPPPLEVIELFVSGASDNRVDLVFFSDGYLQEERGKFIEDARRLARDVSSNQTFNTVKPLLNFWAAFSPSKESGIGVGGKPKDTPFGLYRDGTELRGVYYKHPEVAKAACDSLGTQCDYPILLGNDPFYGGLGGDFTVITASIDNGPLVLRHELGHSIIEVGEEYDGAETYFGANHAESLESLPWAHWLARDWEHRAERSDMPFQAYPWTMLNTSKAWSHSFTSSGLYFRQLFKFSLSGLADASDLSVLLDGQALDWTPRKDIGLDRWHYDLHRVGGLKGGDHEITFKLNNREREGNAQLCSVEVLEFGEKDEFEISPGYYGAFPTYTENNRIHYRPTNDDCLMRSVVKPTFCSVCMEALWLSLLRRVDLIEGVREGCQWEIDPLHKKGTWKKTLELDLIPLGPLRKDRITSQANYQENYAIDWKKDGQLLTNWANATRIEVDNGASVGYYEARVRFWTEEVRRDLDGVSQAAVDYRVMKKCGR